MFSNRMMRSSILILSSLFLYSCYFNYGNRQPDINYRWDINISPYYVKEYMKTIDSFYSTSQPINSEIVNYPEDFIPVTDSSLRYKYLIEFSSFDKNKSIESHYIGLASIYDF